MINYDEILNEIKSYSDIKRAKFTYRLCEDKHPILGVKVPILRNFAKQISKEVSLEEFLKKNQNYYLEEILLEGFVIGYSNLPFEEKFIYIKSFLPKIQNWLICDTFCPTIKVKKKELPLLWKSLNSFLKSSKEYVARFGIVMLLNNFIVDDYVDEVIILLDKVPCNKYYTSMAKAWTLAEIGIKYYDKLMSYLQKSNHLDTFTYNKTLQKMIESYRITSSQKEILRQMKKK